MKINFCLFFFSLVILLFFGLSPAIYSQSNNPDQQLRQRIVWSGDENTLHYAVEIEKLESNIYRALLREYTTTHFLLVSLQPGDYRFRIIPYDILGQPVESSRWSQFMINSNNNYIDTIVISSVNQNATSPADRISIERADALAARQAEADRIARERAEALAAPTDRIARERAEALAAAEAQRQAEADRIARERAEALAAAEAASQAEADLIARERAEALAAASGTERQAEEDRIARERAEAIAAAEAARQAEADQIAREREEALAAAEAARQAEEERIAKERAEAIAAEQAARQAETDRLARERAEALAAAEAVRQTEADQLARERAEALAAAQAIAAGYSTIIERQRPTLMGRIVLIDTSTGRVIRRSPLDLVHVRTVSFIGGKLIAIAGKNRRGYTVRLIEINPESLTMLKQGDDDIKTGSFLWVNGNDLYAITINLKNNQCFMGRFDINLALQAKSSIAIHPKASISIQDGLLFTNRSDGEPLVLNPIDLSEIRQ